MCSLPSRKEPTYVLLTSASLCHIFFLYSSPVEHTPCTIPSQDALWLSYLFYSEKMLIFLRPPFWSVETQIEAAELLHFLSCLLVMWLILTTGCSGLERLGVGDDFRWKGWRGNGASVNKWPQSCSGWRFQQYWNQWVHSDLAKANRFTGSLIHSHWQ